MFFERCSKKSVRRYLFRVAGYVVMPEHVHLLLGEPQLGSLSTVVQVVKQRTARKVHDVIRGQMWQRRFYDFNVFTEEKVREKLVYMHENPVKRGLPCLLRIGVGVVLDFMVSGNRVW